MVDAECSVFGEDGINRIVDRAAACQVIAERFFQPDADIVARKASAVKTLDCGFEQRRCGRQKDRQAARNVADPGGQTGKSFRFRRVECLIL